MKTIIGFDSWTGGAHNFERLVKAFQESGFEFHLIHIGSWGADVGCPSTQRLGALNIKDICHYEKSKLTEILEIEEPAAVIFLSTDVFAHRAFNRYCQLKGIPTLHLYHGLVGVQLTSGGNQYKMNLMGRCRFILERLPKALRKIWPLYVHSLFKSRAKLKDWLRFLQDIFKMAVGAYISVAALDSKASICAVYTQADVDHAKNKYGYSDNDIFVVGNPDISRFNLSVNFLGCGALVNRDHNNEVVYIDTALVHGGMSFANQDDYLKFILGVANSLKAQGLKLCIKLHPDHYKTNFPERVRERNIRVISNEDFVPSLLKSRAAMVEPSSAAIIPALLGLPVLMVAFGNLKDQSYGKVLMDYPRSSLLNDVRTALSSIKEIESNPAQGLSTWITNNAGPLPADEMPNRVVNVIVQLVEK
jgi:hypothetical protein